MGACLCPCFANSNRARVGRAQAPNCRFLFSVQHSCGRAGLEDPAQANSQGSSSMRQGVGQVVEANYLGSQDLLRNGHGFAQFKDDGRDSPCCQDVLRCVWWKEPSLTTPTLERSSKVALYLMAPGWKTKTMTLHCSTKWDGSSLASM